MKTKDDGCVATGCLWVLIIFMLILVIGKCSEQNSRSPVHYNRDDETLTDDEFENKPFDELSDEEKKQAVDRIGKDLEISEDD